VNDLFNSLIDLNWSGWFRGFKKLTIINSIIKENTIVLKLSNDDYIKIESLDTIYHVYINKKLIYKSNKLDKNWLYHLYEWYLKSKGWKLQ
jgi:hypothetical protein